MKQKIFTYILTLMVPFLFGSYAPPENKNEVLINLIMQGLKRSHYLSINIDDEFSGKSFELYLKRLDYYKRFLMQTDIEQLQKYKYQIDDEINNASFEFFDLSTNIINKRIIEAKNYYKEILSKPFDFENNEIIELDAEKMHYARDITELKEYWRKSLKYQTMTRLANLLQIQEKAKENNDTTVEIKSFKILEEEARKKILKNNDDFFKRILKYELSDRLANYINAVVNVFDPHSGYYPPKDKENFDIYISGRLEGIGAQLREKDGYIKVVRIVPGSASWKQGELKAGDIILAVGQGSDEPVDVVDMRLDHAVKLIRGKKGTEVRLTIKKLDGNIIVIPIIRDIVILEETYAKSAIIRDKIRVGYIKLPKFYADFNKPGGRHCAEDVRKEIEKLKKENIKGIILDLRNNGGGSLQDAVDMAGLFIEKGPIVQVKSRTGAPYVLNDKDPKIIYDGPLIIMVNSFSVSASEILAAAIQDYNRGIIIGSFSTFGKGTVQRFFNLDNFIRGQADDIKPLGSLKLTTQKFYRIDGKSTQLKGVIPDIILPDNYSYIEVGEKEHDYPLAWDTIQRVNFNKWSMLSKKFDKIKQHSNLRIKKDSTFILIKENAMRLKKQRDITTYSLNLVQYRKEQNIVKKEAAKYNNIQKNIPELNISALKADIKDNNTDSTKIERIKAWHKTLKKDVYLLEALRVVEDMN